jgi:hypothetical protein
MTDQELAAAALAELSPLDGWAAQCHAASLQLVRSGVLGPSRVARGSCRGVGGQHSWVVLGDDCYHPLAKIVDPTLWSYDKTVSGIWVGTANVRHQPHGAGSIWNWGRPDAASEEPLELTPDRPWSPEASAFLDLLGPLDQRGWVMLAHAPVEGWPAGEVIEAMVNSGLGGYVPVDIIGMVTELNPNGLYLREEMTE